MANIVITAVGGQNYYKATMNDCSTAIGFEYIHFWKEDILSVEKDNNNSYVSMIMRFSDKPFILSYDAQDGACIVDSVLGVATTSIDDLATKLSNIRG